jgi:AcrR family transcriptional regulator
MHRDARPYHHDDLHGALVTEALARVRAEGAPAVSLRAVARAVGVSPSAAYHHFADKDALLAAVGTAGHEELDRRVTTAATGVPGIDATDVIDRLGAVGQAYVGFAAEEPHLFRLAFGPLCAADVAAKKEESSEAYAILCRCLDDLDRLGALRPDTRAGLDMVLWTMVHGLACLVLEGMAAPENGAALFDTVRRVALLDPRLT